MRRNGGGGQRERGKEEKEKGEREKGKKGEGEWERRERNGGGGEGRRQWVKAHNYANYTHIHSVHVSEMCPLTCHVSSHEDWEFFPSESRDDIVTVTLSHVAMKQP